MKKKKIFYMFIPAILITMSIVQWYTYTRVKYYTHEHFKRLAEPCPAKCNNKACCISEKLIIASDIMNDGINKYKKLIPDPSWDGTPGNIQTLLRDFAAVTSSTILTVARSGKLVVDTGGLAADLGSAFIESVQ
jgi:hypothetical protein